MTKEKLKNKLDIIDGRFTVKEAKEVLLHLYGMKINFHEQRNHAYMERFGTYCKMSLKRIPELRANIKEVKSILEQAEIGDMEIVITSQINIDLVPKTADKLVEA